MDIDWFTLLLQVVNFLVLVGLLKYFLYGRIVAAMRQREEAFAARQEEIDRARTEAEAERTRHQEKVRELDEQTAELLAQARAAAETERRRLVEDARVEVEEQRTRWRRSLRQEQESFLRELRRRAGDRLCAAARQALADLADVDLQQRMRAILLARLSRSTPERDRLLEALRASDQPLVVRSAFPLKPEERDHLTRTLETDLGLTAPVGFEEEPDLICGLEFGIGAHRFGWNVATYLETFEAAYLEALERLDLRA